MAPMGPRTSGPSPSHQVVSVAMSRNRWTPMSLKTRPVPVASWDQTRDAAVADADVAISSSRFKGMAMSWPWTRMSIRVSRFVRPTLDRRDPTVARSSPMSCSTGCSALCRAESRIIRFMPPRLPGCLITPATHRRSAAVAGSGGRPRPAPSIRDTARRGATPPRRAVPAGPLCGVAGRRSPTTPRCRSSPSSRLRRCVPGQTPAGTSTML